MLARIVEVVSGQPFDQLLATRLFGPLGASPTEFQLETGEHPRIAFTSDGAGKITGAILNSGPQQVSGTKVE